MTNKDCSNVFSLYTDDEQPINKLDVALAELLRKQEDLEQKLQRLLKTISQGV